MITNAESSMTRAKDILDEVLQERGRQLRKWGNQNHSPQLWAVIEAEEMGEVAKASLEYVGAAQSGDIDTAYLHLRDYRQELVQVAAVAVAAIESLDRNELCETA